MSPRSLLAFILIIPVVLSCSMQEYCRKRFPPEIITKDSIRTVERIVYRDTTVYVRVQGESRSETKEADSVGFAYSSLETSLAKSTATFKDGKLSHDLSQKDSLVATMVKNGVRESYIESYEGLVETKLVIRNELTGWQHTQIFAAWILAGIVLARFLWKKIPAGVISRLLKFFNKSRHPP